MAKPDGRIEKGQRLSTAISARAWNRAQDAADIVLGARPGFAAGEGNVPDIKNWLYARAATALNAYEWCVVKPANLPAPEINPPVDWDSLPQDEKLTAKRAFHETPVIGDVHSARVEALALSSLQQAWQQSHIVLALEPAQVGKIIRVQVSGLVFTEINLRHRYHPAARLVTRLRGGLDNPAQSFPETYNTGFGASWPLESAMCGPARIVWLDTRNYDGPVSGGQVVQLCPAIVSL